jgi:putative Mn2+ efflux pump MntP
VPRLLALFAVCEGGAVAAGMWLGHAPELQLTKIADLLFWASLLLVLLLALRKPKESSHTINRAVYLLPALLSVDNFALGHAFSATGVPAIVCVLAAGATSAALFGFGVICGRVGRACLTRRTSIQLFGTGN